MSNSLRNIIFIFYISILLLYSCKKHETLSPVDVGYSYYPSNVGHWIEYDVDSTYYDGFTHTVRNFQFKLNEKVESTFLDNQNRPTQRLERWVQKNDTLSWYLRNVWASNLTSSTAEKVEDNIRYVKLIFPIAEGQTWNGNAQNSLGSEDYTFNNTYQPYTVNAITYDSTITVIQNNDSNLIYVKYMVEVYAKNIGLIYKKYRDIQKQPNLQHDSIIGGVDYTYRIRSFGN